MRVLAFTFQNAFSTEYGKRNIENALQKMPVDHIAFTMNDEELRKAYTFSVKFMYNFCAICFHYMHYYSYLFAGKNGIPLIVNGRTKGQILQTALKKTTWSHLKRAFPCWILSTRCSMGWRKSFGAKRSSAISGILRQKQFLILRTMRLATKRSCAP